ncbi:MAG: hypothetical protein ABIG95_01135 [Candidatus Woesearchaeota archaeon]
MVDVWTFFFRHKLLLSMLIALGYVAIFRQQCIVLFLLTLLNAGAVYWRTRYNFPVDFTPTVFGLVIVAGGGIAHVLFYVFFGVILPTVITGILSPDAIVFWGSLAVLGGVAWVLHSLPFGILAIGITVSVLKVVFSLGWRAVAGAPLFQAITNEILNLLLNIFLLYRFGVRFSV